MNPILKTLKHLEPLSRQLDPDTTERKQLLHHVTNYAEEFLQALPELPAFTETSDKGIGLYKSPFQEQPRTITQLIDHLRYDINRPGLNPASERHLGYIPGGGLYASALGDYLAAVTNRYAGVFFPSPGAVRMENMILEWMRTLVGYPKETTAGNLAAGGSIAGLIAIVAARDAAELKSKDYARAVVYSSAQAHHSLSKALRIAGLGECIERLVPHDHRYRMKAELLEAMIREDRAKSRLPFLVISSAGTTDTGSVDPNEDIGSICESEKLWLHIDAAYGGFFLLCKSGRDIVRGLERSQSVTMDPHKTLFIPYGSGMVLVRDRSSLRKSHYYFPSYLQDALQAQDELSPADLSPELSKHFRGLRIWMPLLIHGLAPFRAALEEKMLLARYFHSELSKMPRFEVGPYPDLSVVIFRYIPKNGDANEFNQRLVRAIQRDGRIFMSSTVVEQRFTLRFAVSSFRTHLETVNLTLNILREFSEKLANQ